MADTDPKQDEDVETPAAGPNKLVLVLVVTNLLALLGAGGAVAFAFMNPTQSAAAAPAEAAAAPEQLGSLVEVTAFVVNLSDAEGSRYLRAQFQFETRSEDETFVTEHLVPARSAILLYLSGLSFEETQGAENRAAILERVTELANEQIGGDRVRRVYVTDFVVQ